MVSSPPSVQTETGRSRCTWQCTARSSCCLPSGTCTGRCTPPQRSWSGDYIKSEYSIHNQNSNVLKGLMRLCPVNLAIFWINNSKMDGFQRRIFLEVPGLSLTIDHHFLWMESVAGKLEVLQSEKQIKHKSSPLQLPFSIIK